MPASHKLCGPIFPIVTPFVEKDRSYPIDFPSLRLYINYLLSEGAKVIMVASATSRFAQLSEEEIRAINKEVIETVGSRGTAIASTGIMGPTSLHIETAQIAEENGASIIACEYPWRFQNKRALVNYFQAIVDNTRSIEIMLHVTPGRSELGGIYRYDLDSLKEILALPRVIGMKEASGDREHSKEIWRKFASETSIIVAGMASQTYLDAYTYGVSGYFVGTGNIVPKSSLEIYDLVQNGQVEKARKLVEREELVFLGRAKEFGWHAALKAGLAEMGLMADTERPPMVPLEPDQKQILVKAMQQLGWLKKANKVHA